MPPLFVPPRTPDILPFVEGLLERVPTAASPTWRDTVPEVAGTDFRSSSPVEDPVDFGPDGRLNPRAAVGRAQGAEGAKVRTHSGLGKLEEWLAGHDDGVFVLDVAISQKVIAEYMRESVAAKG